MSQAYEDIMASLNELMDAAQGKETGIVRHTRTIKEVESFSPEQIKYVRTSAKMTQKTFAACIGVSQKSVEAWEGGRSKPDGAARRLIGLMRDHADFAQIMGIVSAN
ncbi:MAG: transcriptional regulator [Clostridia bacterium]|nr:transcriptional regulator [Clostridia bacterium]MBR1683802.1 transcriptional regulator [Clostridia bacterium]